MRDSTLPTVATYLAERSEKDHALSRLVRRPESDDGVVHTPREIAQQPLLWRRTARLMRRHEAPLRAFLRDAGLYDPEQHPLLLLTGAGTSDYVGRSVVDLLRTRLGVTTANYPTTRITACPGLYLMPDRPSVMVHFARSGNSPESLAVLQLALTHDRRGTRHLVVTCNRGGDLAALARRHREEVYLIVLDEASNDRGLAMTSSYSSMVAAAQALAYLDDMEAFTESLERVAAAAEYVIDTYADMLYELAVPKLERAVFLGNADLLGVATESALKVQELTAGAVMATGEDPLAFRHGPISAVNGQTLVCFFLSADAFTRRYEIDVLRQYGQAFRELGAQVLTVSARPLADVDHARALVYDPDGRRSVPPYFQAGVGAVVGQLFGLFSACRRDINVDDPSADKTLYSRTVRGVRLYPYTDRTSS